jgi:anion-transporting  ArsA/GET3 family ATPase
MVKMILRDYLEKRIIVCCGSGGVGKTTIAATLALQGAIQGRQALVITIDPAKRLATSLGLSEPTNELCLISAERLINHGIEIKGSLSALMLDARGTVDEVIARYAPTQETQKRILNNRLYQNFSSTFAGVLEYVALEKLYQLYTESPFDLIVLDTPPTRQALDFIETPIKVLNFVQFAGPYLSTQNFWMKMMQRSISGAFRTIENIVGASFLKNVIAFLSSFQELFQGIKVRTEKVKELLTSDQTTTIFLITSPGDLALREAISLYQRLKGYQMPLGGFIVNKVHNLSPDSQHWSEEEQKGFFETLGCWLKTHKDLPEKELQALLQYLEDNFERMRLQAQADEKALKVLKDIAEDPEFIQQIPYFPTDIFDLDGLKKINDILFPK